MIPILENGVYIVIGREEERTMTKAFSENTS